MHPEENRKALHKIIRKSTFTNLKKACLRARLPQLISLVELLEAVGILITREGLKTLVELCLVTLKYGRDYVRRQHLHPDYYLKWLLRKDWYDRTAVNQQLQQLHYTPTISLLVTAGDNDFLWLQPCLQSIINQWYPHWEVHLFGLGSAPEIIRDGLGSWPPGRDPRIQLINNRGYTYPEETINKSLATITGEFVVFPGGQDLLAPTALFDVIKLLNLHPEADIIYADEDTIDFAGRRSDPFFKPDWSPDLALSLPYTGRFTVYRSSLVQGSGRRAGKIWAGGSL